MLYFNTNVGATLVVRHWNGRTSTYTYVNGERQ